MTVRARTVVTETRLSLAELQKANNFTYTFRVFLSACKFWDEENDTWSVDGCQVSDTWSADDCQVSDTWSADGCQVSDT